MFHYSKLSAGYSSILAVNLHDASRKPWRRINKSCIQGPMATVKVVLPPLSWIRGYIYRRLLPSSVEPIDVSYDKAYCRDTY